MTPKKFLLFLLIQWVVFTFIKLWLLNGLVFSSQTFQNWFFYALVAVFFVALVRRFGVISYFEVFFALGVWIVVDLLLDLIITSNFTGLALFKSTVFWYGYLDLFLATVIFHKKRHVYLRKELRAKHSGHH